MADFNQFGSAQPLQPGETEHCARCEAMLADVLDGTLSLEEQAEFDRHIASCSTCSAMLADARRGADWLEMLKSPRPEPSAALLERILAQTCNAEASSQPRLAPRKKRSGLWQPSTLLGHPVGHPVGNPGQVPAAAMQPVGGYASGNVLPFRSRVAGLRSLGQTLLQPRLAMTAAMAFFSIALTLNITGIRVSDLSLSNLRPSVIKRNIYEANAHVLRYYDNLKVVYELESRVRDLQRTSSNDTTYALPSNQSAPAAQPARQQDDQQQDMQQNDPQPGTSKPAAKRARPKPGPGSSRRETPDGHVQFADLVERPDPVPAIQPFVVLTPSILKDLQEGDLV